MYNLVLLVSLADYAIGRRLALADSKDVSTCQAFGSRNNRAAGGGGGVRIIF